MSGGILPRTLGRGGGVLPLAAPGNALDDNRNAILGYLAGALQGGNVGQSIGRGLSGFVQGAARDSREQALPATYDALAQSGLPAPLAHAATLNPDLLKLLAPEYFGGFKVVQTGEDAFGGKTFKLQGPGGRLYDIAQPQAESAPAARSGDGYFAPGVTRVDPRLAGEDYLAQFSPDVQAAVKDYIAGETMPNGDARKGFTQAVKTIARKYAGDLGASAADATFARRRQYREEMGKSDGASAGGRRAAANAALEHLSAVGDLLEELSKQDWFTNYLARGANALESMTADQAGKLNALNAALDRYGGAVAGVHGGQRGGEGARARALARFAATAHPREFAAALQAERDLVHGRLKAMEGERDAVLGPGGGGIEIISAPAARALARIEDNIGRLRGTAPAAPAAP